MKRRKMMQALFGFATMLLFCIPQTTRAQAAHDQERFDASIQEGMVVVLDREAPIKNTYLADISKLPFTSKAEANRAFGRIGDNLVQYEVNWDERTVVIHTHNERLKTDRSIEGWNTYFLKKSQH